MSCAVLRVRHIQPVTRLPILVARCFSSSFSPSSPSSPSLPSSKPPASISATRSTSSAPLNSSEPTEVFPEEEIVPERLISSALSVDPLLAVSSSTDEAGVDRSIQSSHAPVQSGDSSVTFAPTSSISASEYLFHLAEEEEGQAPPSPRPTRATLTQMEDAPWTGDEPIEATIRRMLEDKYQPQRSGTIRSADEKLKAESIKIREVEVFQADAVARMESDSSGNGNGTGRGSGGVVKRPKVWPGHLVGGDPEHRPWHADYVTPSSNVSPLVKRGVLHHDSSKATTSTSAALIASLPKDASGRAVLRHARKLQTGPIRAGRARGAALDYDLGGGKWAPPLTDQHQAGIGKDGESDGLGGKLEVRMGAGDDSLGAGWGSLVELRIDRARAEGQFKNLSGAGKPFERHADQANPFISTSDFFMNRLIQRNDALPPWIMFQQEHTASLEHLRATLAAALHRRLLLHNKLSTKLSVEEIGNLRLKDFELDGQEWSFFEGLVAETNNIGRKFGGIAPSSVRRGATTLAVELERARPLANQMAYDTLHKPPPPLASDVLVNFGRDEVSWAMEWPDPPHWYVRAKEWIGNWRPWKARNSQEEECEGRQVGLEDVDSHKGREHV